MQLFQPEILKGLLLPKESCINFHDPYIFFEKMVNYSQNLTFAILFCRLFTLNECEMSASFFCEKCTPLLATTIFVNS